jgi:hypothetical protein
VGSETDFERLVLGKKDAPQHDGFAWQAPVSSNGINTPAPTPAPARAVSPQPVTTTGAQKFAWSTPSPIVPTPPAPSMGSVLAPSQPAFPAMQPTQPSTAGFGSTSAFRTQSPAPQTSSSGIDWSVAAKPKPAFPANNGMSATPKPPAMNQMLSGLNLGGTPGFGATTSTPAFGGTTSTPAAFGGIKKGGGIQLANFGSPMMPTTTTPSNNFGMNTTGTFGIGAPQKQEQKKQGLDAWESLI